MGARHGDRQLPGLQTIESEVAETVDQDDRLVFRSVRGIDLVLQPAEPGRRRIVVQRLFEQLYVYYVRRQRGLLVYGSRQDLTGYCPDPHRLEAPSWMFVADPLRPCYVPRYRRVLVEPLPLEGLRGGTLLDERGIGTAPNRVCGPVGDAAHRRGELKEGSVMGAVDKIKDKAQVAKGHLKSGAGRATGNADLEVEGKGDQVAGNLKQAGEKVKDALKG